jgi:M6 family metalloprotease-like protein
VKGIDWVIVTIAFLSTAVVAALAQAPGQAAVIELSGTFSILFGDPSPGSGAASRERYFLTDDLPQTRELQIDAATTLSGGGIYSLNGRRVTVRGVAGGDVAVARSAPVRVASMAADNQRARTDAEAAIVGAKPWLSILCKFDDIIDEPRSPTYFHGMYSSGYPGLDHYWDEVSTGLVNVQGSGATMWYTLPQPRSYYLPGNRLDHTRALQDCTAAADPFVYFPAYAGVNLMFNGELDGYAWGARWPLALDGYSGWYGITWEPPWAYENATVVAHEMGHGFGLPHSSGSYGRTYDNPWDVMSDTWSLCALSTHSIYGCLGQQTIAYHKDLLEWLSLRQMSVEAHSAATVRLDAFSSSSSGYQMVRIPIEGSDRFYTLEVRRRVGYDVKLPGEAVVIHEVDPNRNSAPAHVIDADGNGDSGDAGAMWLPGETFVDAATGIRVAINGATATGFRLTVWNRPTFSDDPISTGALIRSTHVIELRTRIDLLRATHGLDDFAWTDATLMAARVPIRAVHFNEMREALAEAYAAADRMPPTYTDSPLVPGVTIVRTVHINELRAAVMALEP